MDDRDPQRPLTADSTPLANTESVSESGWRHALAAQGAGPNEGTAVGQRYTLLSVAGTGGMGEVWRTWDTQLGRVVALKCIKTGSAAPDGVKTRFNSEARITAGLQHPNIVPVYDISDDPAIGPFYTMRLVKTEETLRQEIARFHAGSDPFRASPAKLIRLLNFILDAAAAVGYAHAAGVIHRDIKTANIVISRQKEQEEDGTKDQAESKPGDKPDEGDAVAQLLDWGLARQRNERGGGNTASTGNTGGDTQAGQLLGTPRYMSPEQAAGKIDTLDTRTDVFGLGAVLYEMLTGRPPFPRHGSKGSPEETVRQAAEESPDEVRAVCPTAPAGLAAVCHKAMARNPADRYPTAAALAADLQAWIADEPVTARRDPLATKVRRWVSRHRVLTAATAATVLAIGVAVPLLLRADDARRAAVDREVLQTEARIAAEGRETAEAKARATAEAAAGRNRNTAVDSVRSLDALFQQVRIGATVDPVVSRTLTETTLAALDRSIAALPNDPTVLALKAQTLNRASEVQLEAGDDIARGDALAAEAEVIYRRLLAATPGDKTARAGLADSLVNRGRAAAARADRATERRYRYAARDLYEALFREEPHDPRRMLDLQKAYRGLGAYHTVLGDRVSAEVWFRKAVATSEAAIVATAGKPEARLELVQNLNWLGDCLSWIGDYAEAILIAERAEAECRAVREQIGATRLVGVGLNQSLQVRIGIMADLGRVKDALNLIARAESEARAALRTAPNDVTWKRALLQCQFQRLLLVPATTAPPLQQLIALRRNSAQLIESAIARVKANPASADGLADLAGAWRTHATRCLRLADAVPDWAVSPPDRNRVTAVALAILGGFDRESLLAEAAAALDSSFTILTTLVSKSPDTDRYVEERATTLSRIGNLAVMRGQDGREAKAQSRTVIDIYYRRRIKEAPTDLARVWWQRKLADNLRTTAARAFNRKQWQEADRLLIEAGQLWDAVLMTQPNRPAWLNESLKALTDRRSYLSAALPRTKPADFQTPGYGEYVKIVTVCAARWEVLLKLRPADADLRVRAAEFYKTLYGSVRLEASLRIKQLRARFGDVNELLRRYLDQMEAVYANDPTLARRGPFHSREEVDANAPLVTPINNQLLHYSRQRLKLSLDSRKLSSTADAVQEVVDACINLVVALPDTPHATAEAITTLDRGLTELKALAAAGTIHPYQQRLIGYFQAERDRRIRSFIPPAS